MNSAVTFSREHYASVIAEALPLIRHHYAEVSHNPDIPVDIDHEKYHAAEALGIFRAYTARIQGALVGYLAFMLTKHQHHKDKVLAVQDALYVMPAHRGFGSDLVKFANEQLQADQVDFVFHSVKTEHNFAPMLERLGFRHIESLYELRLDLPRGLGHG